MPACCREEERPEKKVMKSLYVQSIAAPAAQAQGVPKAASGWQSFPCRAAHQEQANRTNIPTLWISGGLSQTWPLEIQSRGFFFLCVCVRLNSMVRQACPYRSWALKMCLCHDRNPLISSAVNIKQIWEGNRTMLWLARLNLSYIMRQWCRTVPTPDPSKSQVQEPSGWYRGSHSWTWSLRRALEFSWNPA